MKHSTSWEVRSVLAIVAALLAASAAAAPIFVVALGRSVDLPNGWKVVEDAGQRGMGFDTPGGERVEIVVWKPDLSPGEILDAKRVAWEHLILLRRSCNFVPDHEESSSTALSAKSLRVWGKADVGGQIWAGAFVACALDEQRACVIGCFAKPDVDAAEAFTLIDDLATAAAGGGGTTPPALVASRPGTTPETSGPPTGESKPLSPGDLRVGVPERPPTHVAGAESAISVGSPPKVLGEVVAQAIQHPVHILSQLALAVLPGSPSRVPGEARLAARPTLDSTAPLVAGTAAPGALRLAATLFPEISLAPAADGRPGRLTVAVVGPERAVTDQTMPGLGMPLAAGQPAPWQAPSASGPAGKLLAARPGTARAALAPAIKPGQATTGGAPAVVAAAPASTGTLPVAATAPGNGASPWLDSTPTSPVGGSAATGASSSEPPGRASTGAITPEAEAAPVTLTPASARPATLPSGGTRGWAVDSAARALRVRVPAGWSVSVKTADGPGGMAILVQGQNSAKPSERFVWAQPALPAYREFTQLLQAMGYREWQPYRDTAGNRILTLATRRTSTSLLEQIVLPESPAKLYSWQVLDAQPSASAAGLVGGTDGLVAHVMASAETGPVEAWYSVATGTPDGEPSYLWVGAWLGAMAKPGDAGAIDALVQTVCGAQVLDKSATSTLASAVAAAQAAVRDLKRGAGQGSGK